MSTGTFGFRVDLIVRGFTCDVGEITERFGIEPTLAIARGTQLGSIIQKRSVWSGRVRVGSSDEEFAGALNRFLEVLEDRAGFVETLIKSDAELLCVIRGGVADDDGIVFQLNLDPSFVKRCGNLGLAFQIEGWTPNDYFLQNAKEVLS